MCGIAGAIQNGKSKITIKTLKAMANGIVKRGRHAYGCSWIGEDGRIRMHKWSGAITDNLDIFDRMAGCKAVIMHTRWATHGNAEANENNHPHPVEGGWLVHNGQIPNYEDLIEEFDLLNSSECDSEVLGLLISEFEGSLIERAKKTIDLCDRTRPLCMAAILPNPVRLVVAKRGNPLFVSVGRSGNLYFSSCRQGLPKGCRPMEQNIVFCHSLQKKNKKRSSTSHMPLEKFVDTGVKVAGSGSMGFKATRKAPVKPEAKESGNQAVGSEDLWSKEDQDRWVEVEKEQGKARTEALRHLANRTGTLPILSRKEGMRKTRFI